MDAELFLKQFGHLAQGEGGIKKVRDIILQLAVCGNLVARDTSGRWTEENLGKISKLITKGATPTTYGFSYQTSGIPFIKVENVKKGTILQNTLNCFISLEAHEFLKRSQLHEHDVLFSIAGTIGETCIIRKEDVPANTNQAFALIRGFQSHLTPEFLKLLLDSFVSNQVKNKARGGAMNNVSLGDISNLNVPLPPLAEQKRILAKVDELMALCDKLEAEQKAQATLKTQAVKSTLHHITDAANPKDFASSFNILTNKFGAWFDDLSTVKNLRATILQLAVQGKLAPQNHTDEPASELLKRIEAEKKWLAKEGKIKASKPLPAIKDSEVPFELPKGWEFSRLGSVYDVRDGTHDSPKYQDSGYPLVTSKDFVNGRISFDKCKFITAEDHEKIQQRSKVDNGDILYSMIGGNIGNMVVVDTEREFSIKNVALFKFYNQSLSPTHFLKIVLQDLTKNIQAQAIGGAQPFVSLGFLRNAAFGLPPLAEQKLIVTKVDELMKLCDQLESQITDTKTLNTHLMDSLINRITEVASSENSAYTNNIRKVATG